jgi:hypothetical protein
VTSTICGEGGKRAKVILVWVRAQGIGIASHPKRLQIMKVRPSAMPSSWRANSRMLITPQLEVGARIDANFSGAMSHDNALEHWLRNGSQNCEGLKRHIFLNIFPNGANKVSMRTYIKQK